MADLRVSVKDFYDLYCTAWANTPALIRRKRAFSRRQFTQMVADHRAAKFADQMVTLETFHAVIISAEKSRLTTLVRNKTAPAENSPAELAAVSTKCRAHRAWQEAEDKVRCYRKSKSKTKKKKKKK